MHNIIYFKIYDFLINFARKKKVIYNNLLSIVLLRKYSLSDTCSQSLNLQ